MLSINNEIELNKQGYKFIFGIDEAGRGPLAGPVVAASFLYLDSHREKMIKMEVNDSKLLSEQKREDIYKKIVNDFDGCYSVSIIEAETIDKINILNATLLAMKNSVEKYSISNKGILLIDGNKKIPNMTIEQKTIISGDRKIYSIAAASIIAKVTRDKIMRELSEKYPDYGFNKHKGYGTKAHMEILKKIGPCPIHRLSYAPVKASIR